MVTAMFPQLQVNGQLQRRMGGKHYFYRQIKEARRVNAPHKKIHEDLKGNVLVIILLFLDIFSISQHGRVVESPGRSAVVLFRA